VLRDAEYLRLQATFLAIAKHSDRPQERARWLALVHACQEVLLTAGETRDQIWTRTGSALHSDLARLAITACRSAKDTSRQPCMAIDQGGDSGDSKERPSASSKHQL